MSDFHSGFVALIGKPNTGKSTFINASLGQKVAITSSKPQTTRARVIGIKTTENSQIIYVDTPGFCKPRHFLGEYLLKVAKEESQGADLVLWMVDACSPVTKEDEEVLEHLSKHLKHKPVFLIINKIDLRPKEMLLPIIAHYESKFNFAQIIPISALKQENISKVEELVIAQLPQGPAYYPEEMHTEQSEDWFLQEIIREKALQLTHHEVPHTVLVVIEENRPGKKGDDLYLRALIYVEKASQKKILIGKDGQKLKNIGILARKEIEEYLHKEVYLDLWVKVKKDWRSHKDFLKGMGYW
jgi:GTPase